MRRTVLLLASMALAMLVASGVALAINTIQCLGGRDFCEGTNQRDKLLGTDRHDSIDGFGRGDILKGFGRGDILLGNAGNDKVYGGRGIDSLYGNLGNDTLYGGHHGDSHGFVEGNEWGNDHISDTSIVDNDYQTGNTIVFANDSQPLTTNLTINLNSDSGPVPEVKNAAGTSTINWSGNVIDNVMDHGSGNDEITGNDASNHLFSAGDNDALTDDTIYGLGGDDSIVVDDNFAGDTVDCGEGENDEVRYDSDDTVTNCEKRYLDGVLQP